MRTETLVDTRGRTWRIRTPTRAWERVRGLIGSDVLGHQEGLLLRTRSIHTVGMRRPVDAVLLDAGLVVLGVISLRPGRVLRPRPRVRWVLETARGSGLRPGDRFSRPARASRG